MCGEGVRGKSLHLPLNFAVNLKLLQKTPKVLIKKKKHLKGETKERKQKQKKRESASWSKQELKTFHLLFGNNFYLL